jgi:hypothetical protein
MLSFKVCYNTTMGKALVFLRIMIQVNKLREKKKLRYLIRCPTIYIIQTGHQSLQSIEMHLEGKALIRPNTHANLITILSRKKCPAQEVAYLISYSI